MANMNRKLTKSKIIKVTLLTIGVVILILCMSMYLLIRSRINKMNLVMTGEENVTEQFDQLVPEPEEEYLDNSQSPAEEIASIEEAIRKNMEENSTPIVYDKNVFNVLLIGSDSRESGGSGRSDAMIIISINKKTKSIIATSLLRDIYLQIPGKENNRLNAAYAYGGASLLMETIEQNFKIPIDRYASVDFYAFMDVVDAVGGVTLEVTQEEIPVINGYVNELNQLTGQEKDKDCLTAAGTLLLNGKQALGYARNRYVGDIDFERTARQRRVLEQILMKVQNLTLLELDDIMNAILPQVTTNLTEGELLSLILSLPKYIGYEIEQWSVPVKGSYSFERIRGMSILGIDFNKNIEEFQNRIYGQSQQGTTE